MSNKLTIQLVGNEENQEDVHLNDFLSELGAINDTLKHLDKSVSRGEKPTLDFRITDLRHQSPATIEIEAIPKKPNEDYSEAVIDNFIQGIGIIQNNKLPSEFDLEILNALSGIGNSFKRSLKNIIISSNGNSVDLHEHLETTINKLIGEEEKMSGSISGMLESLNIHGTNRKFTIYPVAGPKKVNCIFPEELIEIAIHSVSKYINLVGEIKYRKQARFPHEILVKEIEVYPNESELPTLFDIKGIAPMATGGMKSEDFVAEIRQDQ